MKNMNKIMMILVAILAITTTGWSQTTVANEFKYCYDCQRSPAYPTTSDNCELWSFKKPYVGNGSVGNQATSNDGPWKIVYLGEWSATNTFGVSSVSFASSSNTYNYTGSVPIFKLCKKNGSNYDSVAVGVVCAYANTSNTVDHAILFVAAKTTGDLHYGCFLTDKVHSSDVYITFDEDLSSGLPNFKQEASSQVVTNYTLTLSSNNTQYGTVSAVGAGNGTVNNNNVTYTVPAGTQVTVKAEPTALGRFVKWTDNNSTTATREITVNSNTSLTANFAIKTDTLRLNKNINNAGTVTATATSGISGNNPYYVNHNTSVSIQATANTGYRFDKWDDNVTTNPRSITVTSNVTRTANFVREYTITLSTNNNYGTVSISGTGVVDKGNGQYAVPEDSTITITATPNTGSHFVNWDGNQTLTNPTRQITVSSNQTITANFDYKIYNMPSQWTVKANNESVNVTSGTTDGIQDGKTVKITPAPGQKILTVKMKKKTN
jgi:hypothetical protein